MKFLFLPALSNSMTRWNPGGIGSAQYAGPTPRRTNSVLHKLRVPNWMDEELKGTSAYYPHTLITYYYFRDKALRLPKDAYVFGDSGGFSIKRYGMSRRGGAAYQRCVDPVDVLQWQASLCDVGVVLDIPPIDMNGKRIWEEALSTTLKNIKRALPTYQALRTRDKQHAFRWWGVVHGWTQADLETWWRHVSKIYPFDDEGEGWAFKARDLSSSNPIGVSRCLRFIRRHGLTRIHFLAAAAPGAIVTMLLLGPRAGVQLISSDAESGGNLARNRKIIIRTHDGLGYTYLAERGVGRDVRYYLLQRCHCFSCEQLREDAERWPDVVGGKYNEYWTHRFAFHNQIAYCQLMLNLEREAKSNADDDVLLKAVLGSDYGATLRAFEGAAPLRFARSKRKNKGKAEAGARLPNSAAVS